MRYSLAQLTRRARNPRRAQIVLRDIIPPATLATDLYRSVYLPVVQVWERAAPGIVEEYSRTLGSFAADACSAAEAGGSPTPPVSVRLTDSPDDLQARLDAASSEVERLFILLDAALRDFSVRTERWHRSKWASAVLSGTGVSIDTLIGPEDVRAPLSTWLAWNSDLVRDVSAQTKQRISSAVFSGLQNRTPVRDVAKQITEATGFARKRARNIAADQLSKLSGSLADERQRQAGIDKVKWRGSHKLHARKHHAARDGKLYYLETRRAVDGSETVAAGDWVSQPPFCGCRTQGVIDLSED